MSDSTITKTVFLAASRETVWSFLTDKDKLAEWFHPAEADLADGRDYALVSKDEDGSTNRQCWGTVIEMDPPGSLVYSFTVEPLAGALTTVSWTLEDAYGGTRLTLKHEGIGDAAGESALALLMALDAGWDEHIGKLRAALA